MTEAEAIKKWCPYGRTPAEFGDNTFIQNRTETGEPDVGSLCVGSQCMAWRWSRAKETKAYLDAVHARVKETGENFNVATNKVWAAVGSTFEQTEGYCGLAGKPE